MDMLVVAKPIFSRSKTVKGYYLSFQMGNALLEAGKTFAIENSVHSPFFEFVNQIGLEALTLNELIFIPVTNVQLATELENVCAVERGKVVLLLGRRIELTAENLQRMARLKEKGFKLAFIHHTDFNALEPFYPYTDFIFCEADPAVIMPLLGKLKRSGRRAKLIAKNTDTDQAFENLAMYGIELFEGKFYMRVTEGRDNRLSPLKINYIQLLNQVSQDDFELDKFADIVQRDTALALQFLRMVNSSSIRQSKIKTLRHAAAMLGQKEIKKWVSSAVTSSLGQGSPSEITRLSMLRAKFCEDLAGFFEMGMQRDNLFLMGLFSVLDVILETSLENALQIVQVPDKVRTALLTEGNDLGEVYRFVKHYEQADWIEISRVALIKGIAIGDIFSAYNGALTWYGSLLSMADDDPQLTE